MKISIVTPSFNQAAFVQETIESVLRQNWDSVEHIIFDNCSTDGTGLVFKKYPHLRVVSEPDKGQTDALNKGFKAATGDVIGWLNSDDMYLPGCFKTVTDFFKSHPDCDVLYGDYRLVDRKGHILSIRKELPLDFFILKYLHVFYIPTTTTFFRKRIFEEDNFLDARYEYSMDYEFYLRLALKGYRISHIPVLLADFRLHPNSKTKTLSHRQRNDAERILLEYDDFLRGLRWPWRHIMRTSLMLAARFKRTVLKFLNGSYF